MNLPPKALKEPFILETDWKVGGLSGIDYAEVNPTGDWSDYLPTREPQKFRWETSECSSISTTKCIEIQLNYFLKNNLLSDEAKQWFTNNNYIDENGFNLSERFQGIMAGTSINGNSQNQNWETARKVGILPQKDLGYSLEQSEKFLTQWDMCEDYYNPDIITPVMKAKAKLALRYITIQFEWVWANSKKSADIEAIKKALKQAPVQIGAPACPDWNTGDVHPCGKTQAEHATSFYAWTLTGWKDFDHYNPYLKTLSLDYFIPYAIKGVVTINPVKFDGNATISFSVLTRFMEILRDIGIFIKGKMVEAWKT